MALLPYCKFRLPLKMATNNKLYYISESALKNGMRKMWRGGGKKGGKEGKGKKQREKGNGNTIRLYYTELWNHWLLRPNFEYGILNLQLVL